MLVFITRRVHTSRVGQSFGQTLFVFNRSCEECREPSPSEEGDLGKRKLVSMLTTKVLQFRFACSSFVFVKNKT